MAGRHHSQEDRDRALGALMASAVLRGDVWQPNYKQTARLMASSGDPLVVGEATLRRWWGQRNMARDDALRRSVTTARDTLNEQGATDWLTLMYGRCQAALDVVMTEVETEYHEIDREGKKLQPKFLGDRKARAIQTVMDVAPAIEDRLNGKGDKSAHPQGRIRTLRDAINRKRSLTGRSKT